MPRDGSLVSSLVPSVGGVAENVFATVVPSDCRFHGTPLLTISRPLVCQACLSDMGSNASGRCSVCGERLFSKAMVYRSYDSGIREPKLCLGPALLPELIVRHALKIVGGNGGLALNAGVPEPRRETQSRTGLTHHQGRKHMRGAFAVVRPEQMAGREVLLADDVFSTGPTVSECGCFLRRAARLQIGVATVARARTAPAGVQTLPRNVAADRETLAALACVRGS